MKFKYSNMVHPKGPSIQSAAISNRAGGMTEHPDLWLQIRLIDRAVEAIKPRKRLSFSFVNHLLMHYGHSLSDHQPRKLKKISFTDRHFPLYIARDHTLHARMNKEFSYRSSEYYDEIFGAKKPKKRFTKSYMTLVARANGYEVS